MAAKRNRKDAVIQSNSLLDYFVNPSKRTRRDDNVATSSTAKSRLTEQKEVVVISDDDEDQEEAVILQSLTQTNAQQDLSLRCKSNTQALDGELSTENLENHSGERTSMGGLRHNESPVVEKEQNVQEEMEEAEFEEDMDNEFSSHESEIEPPYQDSYGENDVTCPICNISLRKLCTSEAENHVNHCLDSISSPSTMSDQVKTRPLHMKSMPVSGSNHQDPKSAFTVLMNGHKDNLAWKEAMETENKKGNIRGRRAAPFYKVMTGMPIAVDAFCYGKIPEVTAYFLSHAHSDHYTNLSASWKHGPIYCSQITANLIIHMLKVDPKWVKPLPMDVPTIIPDTGGVAVTLIQANHCPGSVLFLFEGQQTVNAGDSTFKSPFVGSSRVFSYLHCGDFRACPQHILHPQIKGKQIDTVYLDTTYLDPKYCFPPQPSVISACAELARRIVQGDRTADQQRRSSDPATPRDTLTSWLNVSEKGKEKMQDNTAKNRVLVIVGTYTIGKERILKAIAKALSTKVYCDARKTAILGCLSDPELHSLLTDDPFEAGVHVVPLHMVSSDRLREYLSNWNGHWTKAVGFRPTGWTFAGPNNSSTNIPLPGIISRDQARTYTYADLQPTKKSTPTLMMYGVPYSEHSSFFELTCFALSFNWTKMIATVNVHSPKSRAGIETWIQKWKTEREKRFKAAGTEHIVQYRSLDHW